MQTFADYLKEFIEKRGISYRKAAEMCGIDRTLLGRYAKGERMPSGKKVLDKIADGLEMDAESQKRLYVLYVNSKNESKNYLFNNYIERIMQEKYDDETGSIKELCDNSDIKENIKEDSIIEIIENEELIKYITYIIENVKCINMRVDPEYENIFRNISLSYDSCSDIDVKCIIRLHGESYHTGVENIKCLYALYPVLSKAKSCSISHYYKKSEEMCKSEVNFIISEKGMVLFDKSLCNGIFTNKKEYMQYYQKVFQKLNEKCDLFAYAYKKVREKDDCLQNSSSKQIIHNVEKNIVEISDEINNTVYIAEGSLIQKFILYTQYSDGINKSFE